MNAVAENVDKRLQGASFKPVPNIISGQLTYPQFYPQAPGHW
jgi:hypothetical protein